VDVEVCLLYYTGATFDSLLPLSLMGKSYWSPTPSCLPQSTTLYPARHAHRQAPDQVIATITSQLCTYPPPIRSLYIIVSFRSCCILPTMQRDVRFLSSKMRLLLPPTMECIFVVRYCAAFATSVSCTIVTRSCPIIHRLVLDGHTTNRTTALPARRLCCLLVVPPMPLWTASHIVSRTMTRP
jgi:hypothetical protein